MGIRSTQSAATSGQLDEIIAHSQALDGQHFLSAATRKWLSGLRHQLPRQFWVHRDRASSAAARLLGAAAFVRGQHIYLGDVTSAQFDHVMRHELVHLAQVRLATHGGEQFALSESIELEADEITVLPSARPVTLAADPNRVYPLVWFIAIGVGAYVLLRPGIANAPGPNDRTFASPSPAQVLGEAICLFAIPGGAFALGGRLGLGFLGSSALAGASGNVSLRVMDDIDKGKASSPLMYVFDASTGAVIGFVVPGGIRLIGRAGVRSLDSLATYGARTSDIALTEVLAQQAAKAPLNAAQAQQILSSRGLGGQISQWWLNRRGVIVLYRGQEQATSQILSPLARQESVAASEALVARVRAHGLSDHEIAGYTARWHTQPVPPFAAPPGLGGMPLGSVGIPATRLPGIAANFGEDGIIYVIRIPRNAAITPMGWQGLAVENEFVILNQVPKGSIVEAIPASRVSPLTVNESGLLIPGR